MKTAKARAGRSRRKERAEQRGERSSRYEGSPWREKVWWRGRDETKGKGKNVSLVLFSVHCFPVNESAKLMLNKVTGASEMSWCVSDLSPFVSPSFVLSSFVACVLVARVRLRVETSVN